MPYFALIANIECLKVLEILGFGRYKLIIPDESVEVEIAELHIDEIELLGVRPSMMVHANKIAMFTLFVKAVNGRRFLQYF